MAHSAGGGPASLAAETAPHLVDRLVYLSACGRRPRLSANRANARYEMPSWPPREGSG
ncbi:hypothetical protein [Streptomyces platensis]|uniref:hypothetical protein n=1 Tax=Streptomyces platensis TaxID=58346 RepID=UPI00369D779B